MDISLWNFYTRLASKYGWRKTGNTGVRYKKGTSYITIEEVGVPFVKVTTTLNHPKHGRTVLVRRLYWSALEPVFKYPRVHTSYGRRKK